MLDSTTSGHFSPEATILMVAIFGTFALFLTAGFVIKIRFHNSEFYPITWIVKPGEIRALLDTALTQRSKMRVSFVRDDPGARSTDSTLLSVNPRKGIELEMTSLVRANTTWVGKLVACDFRLRLDPRKDYQSFYNFVSPVLAVKKASDDFIHMTVAWPTRLELEQKRGFLRIEPQRSSILLADVWHESTIKAARGRFDFPATWGPPLLHMDPEIEFPALEVRNISGGGLRLEILPEALRKQHELFAPGGRFIAHLILAEPEAEKPTEFYLAMRLQNAYGDPVETGIKAFGFRIITFGEPGETPTAPMSWKNATTGVPALDDWTFRRHLSLYRLRGE